MGLDVEESRGERQAVRIDALVGGFGGEGVAGGNGRYAVAADADVAVVPGVAGAVDDFCVDDDDVVRASGVRFGAAQQPGQCPEASGQRGASRLSHARGEVEVSEESASDSS